MAEGSEDDVVEVVSLGPEPEEVNVVHDESDYSNAAALLAVIDNVVKKLRERDHMTKVVFPLLWDLQEMWIIPKFEVTPTYVTYRRENDRRAIYTLKKKESLSIGLNVEAAGVATSASRKESEILPCSSTTASEDCVSIQDLPNEILDHIFSFLDVKQRIRNELVCKRWRLLGKELPWRKATKLYFVHCPTTAPLAIPNNVSIKALQAVLSRCGWCLEQLLLSIHYFDSHMNGVPSQLASTIVQCCPNLVGIELSLYMTNSSLKILAKGCPNLKWVNIKCFNYNYNVGLLSIVKYCRSLERLSLADLPRAGNWFDVVNPKLKSLRLTCCVFLPIALRNLMNQCDAVEELAISFCKPMKQSMFFEVCDHFQHTLKILRFHCGSEMEDFNWRSGLKNLHNLEELSLGHSESVDDNTMDVLAKNCVQLRGLCISLTCVTDVGLTSLKSLPSLKVLDVSMNSILGHGLEALAARGVLEKVYLDTVWSINEECCCTLAVNCPNFRLLDVTGVKKITKNLVREFCRSKKRGFLKCPVQLVLGQTAVTEDVEMCDGVEVTFENRPRPWVANLS